jgi:hypothetical protein
LWFVSLSIMLELTGERANPMKPYVYAQHGHELMVCNFPVGEPRSVIGEIQGVPLGGRFRANSFI